MSTLHIPKHLAGSRILISNDDGIHAEGIHALTDVMREFSDDVWVIAPETEQSGASHSLTLHQPLRSRELGEKRVAVSGTPTDCVFLGVRELLPDDKPVDLIVSGINHGDNMAENVTYSGTIAAAMEGALLDIPSIAFSRALWDGGVLDWDTAKEGVRRVMRSFCGYSFPIGSLLSVNIPDCPIDELRDIKVAVQGRRCIHDAVDARIDPRGRHYYWIGGTSNNLLTPKDDMDCALLAQRHITITPISLDLTNRHMLDTMHQQLKDHGDGAA